MRNPFRGLDAVVYKELRQARKDPATLVMALLIPVIQLTIFGFAIDTEIRDIPTVVVDGARTRTSREFAQGLQATGTFRIVGEAADRDAALSLLRSGVVRTAVIFPSSVAWSASRPSPVRALRK